MPNINVFQPVVHEKMIFKGVCYMYINLCPLRAWSFVTIGT